MPFGILKVMRVAVLALLVCSGLWALDAGKTLTQYAHRIWGQEQGLFQPTIYSILQTRDGFLWLGTQDSLIRFDGANFREFEYRDKAVLHGDLIRALLQDRDGNLWVGSIGGGLSEISPAGVFRRFGVHEGLPGTSVTNLSEAKDGSIWVSTEEGLGRISNGKARMFTAADGLPSSAVRATCEASDGTRWVAGRDFTLGSWNGSHFTRVLGDAVNALACSSDGSVWAGTDTGAVEIRAGRVRRFTTRDGLPDDAVSSLIEGPQGSIWLGTNDGLSRYRAGKFSSYRTRDGLSHSLVLSIAFDREGSVWAGTKDGLDQFFDSAVTPFTTNEGLSSDETSAVLADDGGKLWVGTLDSGLNVFDGAEFKHVNRSNGLLDNHVLSLARSASGDVWAGTNDGVTRLRAGVVAATYALPGQHVRALFVDSSDVVWAATDRGLRRFDGSYFTKVDLPAPGIQNALALAGGRSVRLFVSDDSSRLTYLQDGTFKSRALPPGTHPVTCFLIDHQHRRAWMGTLGSSLMRWQDGKITRVRVRDGLYDNRIYSILRDDHDNLWMASSKGIFRVGEQELNDFADGKRAGVVSIPFTTGQLRFECRSGVQPAACKTPDGRLWFSTTTGLVVIDPNHLNSTEVPPPVRVTALIVDGQRVRFDGLVRIQPREKNLEIHYAGLSFISPEKVTFEYKLDGFGRNWIEAGSRRQAFFTNLPPGKFTFEVRAQSAAGVWSKTAASVSFTVEPKLYQRWWFFPLLSLLLGAAVLGAYRTRVRRLRAEFAIVTAERSRIARELHDTLLQGFSGVTMQLHALWLGMMAGSRERRVLGSIIQDAGQYSAEARQSLWGLRSPDGGTEIFSDRLAALARTATSNSNVSLILETQPFSMEQRPEAEFQLLRIAKEAIANAVKHADAAHLRLGLVVEDEELCLTVQDDGKGFTPDHDYREIGHFGLAGMRERAAEIGAVLEVESSGSGTVLRVRLPLPRNVPVGKTRQTV